MAHIGSVHVVRVFRGRKGDPVMEIGNAIAFPDRRWNPGPVIGSEWKVVVVGRHPTKDLWFVRGIEEINTRGYNASSWERTTKNTFETKVVALETVHRDTGGNREVHYFKVPILDGKSPDTLRSERGFTSMGMGGAYCMAVATYKVSYEFFKTSFFIQQSCEVNFPDLVGAHTIELTVNVHERHDVSDPVQFTIVQAIAA